MKIELTVKRYEIMIQALLINDQRRIAVNEFDDVISVLHKLKRVGVPSQMHGGIQLYDLIAHDIPQSIELERSERNCLISFIKCPIWRADSLEAVQETIVYLEGFKNG